MTLQDVINQCPTSDYSKVEVWVENNPAYDYKDNQDFISLISDPFEFDGSMETITLQEIVDFAEDLEYPKDILKLQCEHQYEQLNSNEWLENRLTLYFS